MQKAKGSTSEQCELGNPKLPDVALGLTRQKPVASRSSQRHDPSGSVDAFTQPTARALPPL